MLFPKEALLELLFFQQKKKAKAKILATYHRQTAAQEPKRNESHSLTKEFKVPPGNSGSSSAWHPEVWEELVKGL